MDDTQLVQELNHKNTQIEIMHGEIKRYADSLEKERRKVSMLTMDNQSYQHQLQHQLQDPPPLPPRSPNFVSDNNCLVCVIIFFISSCSPALTKLNHW